MEPNGLESLWKGLVVAKDEDVSVDLYGAYVNPPEKLNAGASIPKMQTVWEQRGASIPAIQAVNQPSQQQHVSQPNASSNTGKSQES